MLIDNSITGNDIIHICIGINYYKAIKVNINE